MGKQRFYGDLLSSAVLKEPGAIGHCDDARPTESTRDRREKDKAILNEGENTLSLYFASFSLLRVPIIFGDLLGKSGMKFEKLRLIQEESPRPAAENMAIDETLFLRAAYPVLRSYRWVRPSVSFGYFVHWNEVVRRFGERDLVRRWTGGGIVEHGQDFTYSLICPGNESLPTTIEFYRLVHLAISNILQENGCPVEMVSLCESGRSPACFEKAVQFDLKLGDEKIAGAAIRRNRKGLLLQGSIQRLELPAQFEVLLAGALGQCIHYSAVSDLMMEQAADLAKEKYGAAEWNCRR